MFLFNGKENFPGKGTTESPDWIDYFRGSGCHTGGRSRRDRICQSILRNTQIIAGIKDTCEPVSSYCLRYNLPISGLIETTFFEAQKLMLHNKTCVAIFLPFVKSELSKDLVMRNVLKKPLRPKIVAAYDKQVSTKSIKELFSICQKFGERNK